MKNEEKNREFDKFVDTLGIHPHWHPYVDIYNNEIKIDGIVNVAMLKKLLELLELPND